MIALSVAKLKMFSPESEIFLWIKPKEKKKTFLWKVWITPTFRSTRKGKKCFLWWPYVCLITLRCYTTSHLHQVFFDFAWIFSLFSLVFRTSKFLYIKEFNKTIIPFALVGYETGYSQLGATRLVGYLLASRLRQTANVRLKFPVYKKLVKFIWFLLIFCL